MSAVKERMRRTTPPPQPSSGRGRRSLYNPKIHPVLGKWMARCGLTDEEMAREFEVTRQTIHNWRQRYPEFDDALMEGKEVADARVEDSLYRRAVGYEYEERHTELLNVEGRESPVQKVKRVTKHVIPDVQAAIYWLTNRQGHRWKAKQQLELTGKDGEQLSFKVVIKPPSADAGGADGD